MALKDDAEVVLVEVGVIAIDFDDLRNKTSAWSAFELHDNVERISNVRLDRASVFFHDRCVATDRTVNFEPLLFRA